MADIYRITYDDPSGAAIQIDIAKADGSNTVIETARGYGVVKRPELENPFEIIYETECTVNLEASTSQPFSDLFTDSDRQWVIRLWKDSDLKFEGYLDPSDVFEDFVNDEWEMAVTAFCGLGELENIAYDNAGAIYQGKEALGVILTNCLDKTGWPSRDLYLQSRTSAIRQYPLQPFDSPSTKDDWWNLTVSQEAFVTDNSEPLSCLDVLKEILGPANAQVCMIEGAWYVIYVPHHADTTQNGNFYFDKYTGGGGFPTNINRNVNQTVWSEINGGPPYWVNEDLTRRYKPTLAVSRVEYRYTRPAAYNANPDLDNNGVSLSGWTRNVPADVTLNGDGTVTLAAAATLPTMETQATGVTLNEGTIISVYLRYRNDTVYQISRTVIQVEYVVGGTTYWLKDDGTWVTSATSIYVDAVGANTEFQYELSSLPLPGDGTAKMELSVQRPLTSYATELVFDYAQISNKDSTNPQGVTYTVQRTDSASRYKEDAREFKISDFEADIYYIGALFLADTTSKTEYGFDRNINTGAPVELYQAHLEDRIVILQKPSQVFEGSLYGFFEVDRRISIDGITGVFKITSYEWDTKRNTIKVQLYQLHWGNAILASTEFTKRVNYGAVVEPTIRG